MASVRPEFPGGGRYRRLGPSLRERFGETVRKVTVRGGFGCPNRDGRVGTGGCSFCSEVALLPRRGVIDGPLEKQLESGLQMVARRGADKAIAYFQDQTATDAEFDVLKDLYGRAHAHPKVVALAVGTRPDWIEEPVLELLAGLNRTKPVFLELGLQTANDDLLRSINRGHTVRVFEEAVERAHAHGLEVTAHVVLDLPGETPGDRDATARCLNRNSVEGVKIHNLHILDETPMAQAYRKGSIQLSSLEEYAAMAEAFLEKLDPAMVIHRLTGEGPAELMLAPSWGLDKNGILNRIHKILESRDGWQGKQFGGDQGAD